MKILKKIFILSFVFLFSIINTSFAQDSRGKYGSDPLQILDEVNYQANRYGAAYKIQDTQLEKIYTSPGLYRITNTLDRIRRNIYPYLQRAIYIGFVAATLILVFRGFKLVTGTIDKGSDVNKLKTALLNIGIGIVLLVGFYGILQIIIAIINAVVGNTPKVS